MPECTHPLCEGRWSTCRSCEAPRPTTTYGSPRLYARARPSLNFALTYQDGEELDIPSDIELAGLSEEDFRIAYAVFTKTQAELRGIQNPPPLKPASVNRRCGAGLRWRFVRQRITLTRCFGEPKNRSRMSSGSSWKLSPRKPARTVTGLRYTFAVDPALWSIPDASASATTRQESLKWLAQSWTGSSKAKPVEDARTVW